MIILLGLWLNQLIFMSIALIGLYILYIIYLYKQSLENRKENAKEIELAYESVKNVKISYIKIFISSIIIYIGVEMSVVAAQQI